MGLASPPVEEFYANHQKLITAINEFAGPHGYDVILRRSKVSKKGILRKIVLKCDRGGKSGNIVGQKRLHIDSKLDECFFDAQTKRIEEKTD